jgi:gliding motility-associated-like protein
LYLVVPKSVRNPLVKNANCKIIFVWVICMLLHTSSFAQLPPIQWIKQYGGSSTEIPYSIKCTADGGTIVAGYTDSKDGEVQAHLHRDYWDLWILKLDKCGNIQWEKSFGGTDYETAKDVVQTSDGGYIVLGETSSTDGDVVPGYESTRDIWVLRIDVNGSLLWQKRFGGTGLDVGNNIYAMADGNYLIAASSSSNDGDISGNHGTGGYTDGVLLKIDPNGKKLWSKCFGGSKNDELLSIQVTGSKIFVAGYANSIDGDIPVTQKNYDVWLLATDLNGNKLSSKIYGGSQNDVAYSMALGKDNTLTLAGYTTSNDGDVQGAKGSQDFWIINVDLQGKIRWQQTLGGTDAEFANTVITDKDGGYIVGGVSYSKDLDVDAAKGMGDYWIIKLTAGGQLSWKKNIGGKLDDNLHSIAYQPTLHEYYFAGDTQSRQGDFDLGNGGADFGIIKCKIIDTVFTDTIVCPGTPFTQIADTVTDVCGYDSAIAAYRIITTNCESSHLLQSDTIYVPNAFTPNNDGKNDVFGAAGKIQGVFFMQVFNRYGELVFQSSSISNRWNGMYKNQLQQTGAFVYAIRYMNNRKQVVIKKGSFLLIRQ